MPVHEFSGAAASPLAGNTISTDENFLTIENGAGSGRTLYVWVAWSVQDQSQVYSTPMHLYKCSAMPSGGNVVAKPSVGGGGSSASQVVVRTSRTTDNGSITAITTSGEQDAWRVWPPRIAANAGGHSMGSVWGSPLDRFIELLEGEALLLRHNFSTSPNSTTNSNRRESGMVYWQEFSPDAGQSVTITPGTETDTAQALTFTKAIVKSLVTATETDTAQALSVTKTIFVSITPATETDAAQAVDVDKAVTLGSGTETDTAQALSVSHAIVVTLTAATETDAAQVLSVTKTIFVTITPAAETDTAQAIDVDKSVVIAPSTETDTAQGVAITGPKSILPATESDTAQALDTDKLVTLASALSTDTAQLLQVVHSVSIIPATEADVAQGIAGQVITLVPVGETDTALALSYVLDRIPRYLPDTGDHYGTYREYVRLRPHGWRYPLD